jgi:hypothetical protein
MDEKSEGALDGSALTAESSQQNNQSCDRTISWARGRIGAALEASRRIEEPDQERIREISEREAPDYSAEYRNGILQQTAKKHERESQHVEQALRDVLEVLNELECQQEGRE